MHGPSPKAMHPEIARSEQVRPPGADPKFPASLDVRSPGQRQSRWRCWPALPRRLRTRKAGPLDDAERLAGAGPCARAHSLSALAVEEFGKAASLAASASMLRDPGVQTRFADPPAEAVEFWRALVLAFAEAGNFRPPKRAAVALNAVGRLQDHIAGPGSR